MFNPLTPGNSELAASHW